MCYFFSLAEEEIKLQQRYNAKFEEYGKLEPRKIINGFTYPETIVLPNETPTLFRFFSWGLIPRWCKTRDEAKEIRQYTLNARLETIFEKPAFQESAIHRRCLVPVNAFYEWKHEGSKKIKHFIKLIDHNIFSLGGLWSEWVDKETGEVLRTFTIVTMPANSLMARVHNTKKRMPVMLPAEIEFEWLKEDNTKSHLEELANYCSEDRIMAIPYSD